MRSEWLETAECDGWRLRVEFHWQVDRFRHVIFAVDSTGIATPLLESIEGSPADDWPPSPPLQSLHCESQPDGSRVALLVGMAGRGHWSASIGPQPHESRLVFDIACRTAIAAAQLESRYRLDRAARFRSVTRDRIEIDHAGQRITIRPSQQEPTRCAFTVLGDTEFQVRPIETPAARSTHRWLYEMAVCSEF